jgi:hypothetical protein
MPTLLKPAERGCGLVSRLDRRWAAARRVVPELYSYITALFFGGECAR